MDTFVWDENFHFDFFQVDEQHHKLMNMFNKLCHSIILVEANRGSLMRDTPQLGIYERVESLQKIVDSKSYMSAFERLELLPFDAIMR